MKSKPQTIISQVDKENLFVILCSYLSISLFLPAGFISLGIILITIYAFTFGQPLKEVSFKNNILLVVPILLFVAFLIWMIGSDDWNEGSTRLVRKISLAAIPLSFIIINKRLTAKNLERILICFATGLILCSFYCYAHAFMNIIRNNSFIIPGLERPYYYFSYIPLVEPAGFMPIYLGFYGNLAFIIVLETTLIKNKILKGFLIAYIFIFIILIAAKIGIIALLIVLVLYGLIKLSGRNRLIFLSFIIVVSFSAFNLRFVKERFLLSSEFDYTWPDPHQWNSITLRLAIWKCSWDAISRNYTWGYGTGDGQKALEEIYKEYGFTRALAESYNAHNEFFSTTLDIGIIGILLLVILIIGSVASAFRERNIIQISFIALCGIFFLVESILLRQKGVVFFSLFFSMFFNGSFSHYTREENYKKSPGETFIQ